ncbi:MAG: transcriptional repressor LexA [Xanthomonadales bacterium]|nr:transcriptional repressor LexA [Xanthomonadales bacterium]
MSKPSTLTARQRQILDWIIAFQRDQGAPPTRLEICRAFGFRSPNAAESHLRALADKGAIDLTGGRARGIRLPARSNSERSLARSGRRNSLPLIGQVAAGSPILAEQNVEDEIELGGQSFKPTAHYLLRVRGDSMIDAGILDGDLLAVHRTQTASDGQIVVARLGEEVTVKRLRHAGDRILLLPANPAYAPIEVNADGEPCSIEGLGVGVLRRGLS